MVGWFVDVNISLTIKKKEDNYGQLHQDFLLLYPNYKFTSVSIVIISTQGFVSKCVNDNGHYLELNQPTRILQTQSTNVTADICNDVLKFKLSHFF